MTKTEQIIKELEAELSEYQTKVDNMDLDEIRKKLLYNFIGMDEEWDLIAKFKGLDEVILRHSECLKLTGHTFTFEEFEKYFEKQCNHKYKLKTPRGKKERV